MYFLTDGRGSRLRRMRIAMRTRYAIVGSAWPALVRGGQRPAVLEPLVDPLAADPHEPAAAAGGAQLPEPDGAVDRTHVHERVFGRPLPRQPRPAIGGGRGPLELLDDLPEPQKELEGELLVLGGPGRRCRGRRDPQRRLL